MIRLESITVLRGTHTALQEMSLAVPSGAFAAVIGPSGAGKSTLVRLIAGLERPQSGKVILDGNEVAGDRWVGPELRGAGMVFQTPALWPHLDCRRHVRMVLQGAGHPDPDGRTNDLLQHVGLQGLARRKPAQLSGGEQRRLSIARALAATQTILLLDEPFAGLDKKMREEVWDLVVQEQAKWGFTVICTTHLYPEIESTIDLCVELDAGRQVRTIPQECSIYNPARKAGPAFHFTNQGRAGLATT